MLPPNAVWTERTFTFGLPLNMLPFYLERLSGTIFRLEGKVRDVSEEVLSEKLEGKWSVKQNIGHLAEVDEIALKRIGEMLQGVSPMTPAIFPTQQDYNSMPVIEVLNYFHKNRLRNIERYSQLNAEELQRSSLHPRLKVQMTPVDLAFFDAEHDDHHLVRINEILNTLQP
jgi:uncharacterized damage-inducible protein DinB